jgi:hypothetical protein
MAESVIAGVESSIAADMHWPTTESGQVGMLACADASCGCLADDAFPDPRPPGRKAYKEPSMRSPFPFFWLLAALAATGLMTMAAPMSAQEAAPAAAASPIRYSGGDGLTLKKSVVIVGAANAGEGEAAELAWIHDHHPGAIFQSRGRITGPPHYDVVTVKLASGALLDLHFEISGFFGK